jgi:drug/metabolite transporter (DMT)-like permease
MSPHSIALTVLCVLLISGGQLLFKTAAMQWKVDGLSWATAAGLFTPVMIAAFAIYTLATFLWVYVLRSVALSSAYSIYALAFLIVPVLAHYVLGERLSANVLIGGGIIVVGIVVAVR